MNTKQETLEDNRLKVTVTVDEKEVETRVNKTYKDFSHRYNFPGFRRGHVPQQVINSALGAESVMVAVTEKLITETYPKVIDTDDLYPIGQPSFDDNGMVEKGKPYEFSFTVEVKPEFELSSYDPVKIELPAEGASDAEVEEQIEVIRGHYDDFVDAPEDAELTAENYAELVIEATDENGNAIASISSERRLFGSGSGMFSEAFDNEVLGMKKGESKTFTLDVPPDETAVLLASQAGNRVTFTVTCDAVRDKTIPELTDEWVKNTLGFDDIAALRQGITDSVVMQKNTIIPRLKETRCLDALVERLDGEAPASMTEEAETNLLQDFFSRLQAKGDTFDAYLKQEGITADEFKEDIKKQASLTAKQELALDAWARHYDLKATDEEVRGEFVRAGLKNPEVTEREWRENGRLYLVREGIMRGKAAQDLMEKAVVTEVDYAESATKEQEEVPTDGAPTDEAQVDDLAEDRPVEEASVEETVSEETASEEASEERPRDEEESSEETSAAESPKEDSSEESSPTEKKAE